MDGKNQKTELGCKENPKVLRFPKKRLKKGAVPSQYLPGATLNSEVDVVC